MQDVRPLDADKPTMVGEAFTLRYIPAREDLNPITVFVEIFTSGLRLQSISGNQLPLFVVISIGVFIDDFSSASILCHPQVISCLTTTIRIFYSPG